MLTMQYRFMKKLKKDVLTRYQRELVCPVMIDHCEASRAALTALGMPIILCDWHAYQNIDERIRKSFPRDAELQEEVRSLTKQVQRARNQQDADAALKSLLDFCENQAYVDYLQSYYTDGDWGRAFCDRYRSDDREGLFNTNNASETFFRTLLRK